MTKIVVTVENGILTSIVADGPVEYTVREKWCGTACSCRDREIVSSAITRHNAKIDPDQVLASFASAEETEET